MSKDLENREDVAKLVREFYTKVRKNEEIGHYFNESIQNWEEHLEKLTDFWEGNLFFKNKYKGNPKSAHIKVDEGFNHSVEQRHFGIWLNLWFETIDTYFEGEKANRAKNNARKMASHLFMSIFKNRKFLFTK